MKTLLSCGLLTLSLSTFAEAFHCSGEATLKGTFFNKKVSLVMDLNALEDGSGRLGHLVELDGKRYPHAPDVSSCVSGQNTVICKGAGVGNGPELIVKIDRLSGVGSGTYFNPEARNYNSPNPYNTYAFENLTCR